MDCSIVREYIPSYIDQELSDDISAQLDKHLESCENCRKELQAQLGLHRLLSEKLERKNAPADIQEGILSGLARQRVLSPSWLFKKFSVEMRPVTGFAVAALLILSFFSRDIFDKVVSGSSPQRMNVPVLQGSHVAADEADTITLKDGVRATVVGQVVCIGCYLRENFHANYNCIEHGHHIGLITNDGNLWSFAANVKANNIILNELMLGKSIRIDGDIFYNAHYIDIHEFQYVNQGN